MLLAVYRLLYVPLNGAATLLLLVAGVLAWVVPDEARATRLGGVVIVASAFVQVLATLLRRHPTSGLALAVGIMAMLAAAVPLGMLGTSLARLPVLLACGCQGALVVLCTLVRADEQGAARDSVVK